MGKKVKKKKRSSGKAPANYYSDASTSADLVCSFDPSASHPQVKCNSNSCLSATTTCVPILSNSVAGRFTTDNSGNGLFNVELGDDVFPVNQLIVNGNKKYALILEPYSKSLTEWINDSATMEVVYSGTPYEKNQPTEEAKMVVQGLLTAFGNQVASEEENCYLNCLDNFLLTLPVYDHHSSLAHENAQVKLDKAGEYVDKVKVIIVQDAKLGMLTTTLRKRRMAIVDIIFDKIFKGQNKLPEWMDLRYALNRHNFAYADCHPCLWSWKKRLIFFVDLSSYISNRNDNLNSIAYKAIIDTDVFDKDWRRELDGDHEAPLKKVLQHRYDKDDGDDTSDATTSSKYKFCKPDDQTRWKEGRHQIRWMKNCFNHLTERRMNPILKQRCYTNIDFLTDDPLYKDLRFLNHMVTHFLYPHLWIKLFTNLHKGGYRI